MSALNMTVLRRATLVVALLSAVSAASGQTAERRNESSATDQSTNNSSTGEEDSLSRLREDCDRALKGSLAKADFAALRDRIQRYLARERDTTNRLSALKLAGRLCWDGPQDDADSFREFALNEIVPLATASPRARVLLLEQFLPPLLRADAKDQPAILSRFDTLVDRLMAAAPDSTTKTDLSFLKCKARIEAFRAWDAPWLNADERERLDGWLGDLERSEIEAPAGGAYRDQATQLRNELREMTFGRNVGEFEATALDGRKTQLSEFRGKVVVLSFWSSWCLPCLEMIPHEADLVRRLGDRGLAVVGVNSDENIEQGKRVASERQMTWPQLSAPQNGADTLVTRFHVRQWPSVVVLDRTGAIRAKFVGSLYQGRWTVDDVEREVLKLLASE